MGSESMGSSKPVNEASITGLMRDCSCTRKRAISLLQLCSNDVEKAKFHHQLYTKYRSSLPPSPSSPSRQPADSERPYDPRSRTPSHFQGQSPPNSGPSMSTVRPFMPPPRPVELPESSSRPVTPHKEIQEAEGYGVNPSHKRPLAGFPPSTGSSSSTLDTEREPAAIATPHADSDSEDSRSVASQKPESPEPVEWDFVLPDVPHSGQLLPGVDNGQGTDDFSTENLAGAVLHGADSQAVSNYLGYYDEKTVKQHLQGEVRGFPSIFYAVASNDVGMVRLWVSHGAEVSATHGPSGTPLLAFAIVNGDNIDGDTTAMVTTLLSLGASPRAVPEDLYKNFYDHEKQEAPQGAAPGEDEDAAWCTGAARERLARSLNLTHRYLLERSTRLKRASVRHRQVARLRNAEPILGVPYFLIGQTVAAGRLVQKLLSHLMIPSRRPLVLIFAGPSGHGKTELARRMGHLLGLPLNIVDCTIVNREMELFGPRHPYTGADRGSPLNNFLAENAGRRCVVFMDEFEKTTRDIHQALLVPFDNGEYQDRRDLSKVDCSNTIWILATNALDDTIKNFCHKKPQIFDDEGAERETLVKQLSKILRADFLRQFDAPITGRISDFIPFLTFSPAEQAAVVHKFLLELIQKVRAPVKLSKASSTSPSEQLLGNVNLRAKRDLAVCKRLAADYSPDLGARSMITAVEHVKELLMDAYLEEEEEIVEGGGMRDFLVDVHGGEVAVHGVKGQTHGGE